MTNKFLSVLLTFFCGLLMSKENSITITVWVHGTYPVLKLLGHERSPIRSKVYAKPGLSLAKELPSDYYFKMLSKELFLQNPDEYNSNCFYTYGWHSSTVRPGKRKDEGAKLYASLCTLLEEYQKDYDHITLRLVGVSHGGNVILNCISHMPFITEKVDTEVILFLTPVQESTRNYVNNKAVKRIYSFYSDTDWMQRIDIQKFHKDAPKQCPFWSKRTFEESDRVVQIRLKVDGKFFAHSANRSVVKYLPRIMEQVNKKIDNQDKVHIDLDFKT